MLREEFRKPAHLVETTDDASGAAIWFDVGDSGMSNADIDRYYDTARAAGALGGKVVGAGAGGFLMVYAPEPNRVRRAMRAEGLGELRFRFDHLGSTVLTAG